MLVTNEHSQALIQRFVVKLNGAIVSSQLSSQSEALEYIRNYIPVDQQGLAEIAAIDPTSNREILLG